MGKRRFEGQPDSNQSKNIRRSNPVWEAPRKKTFIKLQEFLFSITTLILGVFCVVVFFAYRSYQ